MPLPDTISGKNATGKVNGVTIDGTHQWEFEEAADNLDGTTGSDGGYGKPYAGVLQGTVRLRVWFNVASGVYTTIRATNRITNLLLYDDIVNGSPTVTIPEAEVIRSTKTAEVRGRIEVTIEAMTRGAYTVSDP